MQLVEYDYEIYNDEVDDEKGYDKDVYLKEICKFLGYGGIYVQNNG